MFSQQQHRPGPSRRSVPLTKARISSRRYPNPGYLGSSSHATIYDHLQPSESLEINTSSPEQTERCHGRSDPVAPDADISHGAILFEQITGALHMSSCMKLIAAWIAKGVNLALAGPFTKQCTQSIESLVDSIISGPDIAAEVSRTLFINSYSPLKVEATDTVEDFCNRFCRTNARWETLGLFLTAISRATIDFASFEPLYSTDYERHNFQKLAMHYADRCLDISLSLDCLNDLQLLLQYENFINHSFVDGDQSMSCSLP